MATPAAERRSVLIEGVPFLGWGESGESTFAGALSVASSAAGVPVTYARLLGMTGLAFRVRWYNGVDARWCPSSPCGEFPPYVEAAGKALGFRIRSIWGQEAISGAAGEVAAEIRAGRPVLVYDDSMNMALAVGCEDGGRTLILHEYGSPSEPTVRPLASRPMFVMLLGEPVRRLPEEEALRQGLQVGLKDWHARHDPPEDDLSGYWMGGEAYRRWIHDLADAGSLSLDERAQLFFVSCWNYDVTSDVRRHAGPFLRECSQFMRCAAAKEALRAADLYDEASSRLLGPLFDQSAFLGRRNGEGVASWTAEQRKLEREVLTLVEALEAQAMEHLERAVDLW